MGLMKEEYFRFLNETLTTCTAILNTIDSRSIRGIKASFFYASVRTISK